MNRIGKVIVAFTLFVFLMVAMNRMNKQRVKENINREISEDFKGVVKRIEFTLRNEVILEINNDQKMELTFLGIRKRNNWFRVGDSVVKDANGRIVEHYKIKDGEYFLYVTYDILEDFQFSD